MLISRQYCFTINLPRISVLLYHILTGTYFFFQIKEKQGGSTTAAGHQCQVLRRSKIYRQLNCHLLLIWMPPTECIFIHSCIHVYIYMLILRVMWIIWMYCAFSHVYNKMATKINYTLDHHEFVLKNELITLQTAKQTAHCTSCLFSGLFVTKRQ